MRIPLCDGVSVADARGPVQPSARHVRLDHLAALLLAGGLLTQALPVTAAARRPVPEPMASKLVADPSERLGLIGEDPAIAPGMATEREAWGAFRARMGGRWAVLLDRRSGAPLLVEGPGIFWIPEADASDNLDDLERLARAFVRAWERTFRVAERELVLDREASGPMDQGHIQLVFNRQLDSVPVEGQRLLLYLSRGSLVAFGTTGWGRIEDSPLPSISAAQARQALVRHLSLPPATSIVTLGAPRLVFVPASSSLQEETSNHYVGHVGAGARFLLAWRWRFSVSGIDGTWQVKVDARSGRVISLTDLIRQAHVKGGAFGASNDGQGAGGSERAGFPAPSVNLTVGASTQTAGPHGRFDCSPIGAPTSTSLVGPFVRAQDLCGPIQASVSCDADLDLGTGIGTDCTVAGGSSLGNTRAARTSFFHLNRIRDKAMAWLPGVEWLEETIAAETNWPPPCGGSYDGDANVLSFSQSETLCRNGGETPGVVQHEWGHGLDFHDGGAEDNPYEAYADLAAILQDRRSCVGRGFWVGRTCDGYGDACLTCTGVREMDWDQHASHTPATPQNWVQQHCYSGFDAPCGGSNHCEGHILAEAVYDLAARDLPASGIDTATAWQLTERLFYGTRQGSGGNAYNCALPASDGCGAGAWFTRLRVLDDEDGNLSNGTPHAAAIFAAFARHGIACGSAGDASNQNSSTCTALAAPLLSAEGLSEAVRLTWAAVAGAARYHAFRTEIGCDYSGVRIATVEAPGTEWIDHGLRNGLVVHYWVQAEGANPSCLSAVSACASVIPTAAAGSIELDRGAYSCSAPAQATVLDGNSGAANVPVSIWSASEPSGESLSLVETSPGSGRFRGSIPLTTDSPAPDGRLTVSHGETVTARYIDVNDGRGGSNLPREARSKVDCVPPVISGTASESVSDRQAVITWSTSEPADSTVLYGETPPPGQPKSRTPRVLSHQVTLKGLRECTVHAYAARSSDGATEVTDDAGGAFHVFETLGDFGAGLQSCRDGRVHIERDPSRCGDALPLFLVDLDLNRDREATETATVEVTSSIEATPERLVLTETGPDTGQFIGTLPTGAGAPSPDGVLQMGDGDVVTATYHDARDSMGRVAVAYDMALADCAAPEISDLMVTDLSEESALVRWTTSESSTGRVEWGPTPSLGNVVQSPTPAANHAAFLYPLTSCGRYYLRVHAQDLSGNPTDTGAPFGFNALRIPGLAFRDGFESLAGWTLEGEWQIGTPQGLPPNLPDPVSAYRGTQVLGHDLTGLGTRPGAYEPGTTQRAISPVINASGLANGVLKFRRWLNVLGGGPVSSIEARKGGVWTTVWSSGSLGVQESDWSSQTVNISTWADGNATLQIAYKQTGGPPALPAAGGWNIDRLIVKDGTQPDFQACGDCTGAPAFAGAVSAEDLDPCAATGILVRWQPAPAWGSGSSGTYSVYRGPAPGFLPGASNRVATGHPGTSWTDLGAPPGTTVYYLVRAENNEACSGGPNNGGVTDGNEAYQPGWDDTSQPLPGEAGSTLRASAVNDVHVRLTWDVTSGAASYRVFRSDGASGPFSLLGEVAATFFDDLGEMVGPSSRYYQVRAVNSCGVERP